MNENQPDTVTEGRSGYYKGVYIECIGGTWRPYRIQLPDEDNKPRYFANLNEAKGFISWWKEWK